MNDQAQSVSIWRELCVAWSDASNGRVFRVLFDEGTSRKVLIVFYWVPIALCIYALVAFAAYFLKAQWFNDWLWMLKPIANVVATLVPYELWEAKFGRSAPLAEHLVTVGGAVALVSLIAGLLAVLTRNASDWHRLSTAIPHRRRMMIFGMTFGGGLGMMLFAALTIKLGELIALPFLPLWFTYLGLVAAIFVTQMKAARRAQ